MYFKYHIFIHPIKGFSVQQTFQNTVGGTLYLTHYITEQVSQRF